MTFTQLERTLDASSCFIHTVGFGTAETYTATLKSGEESVLYTDRSVVIWEGSNTHRYCAHPLASFTKSGW